RREIPPDGLGIEPDLGGDPFRRHALAPQPQDFLEVKHRDLAIHLASWPRCRSRTETSCARSGAGGKVLKNPPPRGNGLKSSVLRGMVLKKPSERGGLRFWKTNR